jgi:hypothetical protein
VSAGVESGALRGSSCEELVVELELLELSDGGASGISSSLAPGRGLAGSGGGTGRVAEGASGMSLGVCCADNGTDKVPASDIESNPASSDASPILNSALVFVAIRKTLYLSFLRCP